jgi:hypothetical protein
MIAAANEPKKFLRMDPHKDVFQDANSLVFVLFQHEVDVTAAIIDFNEQLRGTAKIAILIDPTRAAQASRETEKAFGLDFNKEHPS